MIHRLTDYFINKMRETAYAMTPDAVSGVPNFPACIVYLNPAATARHTVISQRLRRVWRGSVNDICQYEAVLSGGKCLYRHPDGSNADLLTELQKMSSNHTRFYDRSRLNIYCVLDTADIHDLKTFVNCINLACSFKQMIRLQNVQMFMVLLLDESLHSIDFAAQVRTWIRSAYDNLNKYFDSMCLLSNRCGNSTFLDDYMMSVVASTAILLTNTHNDTQQTRFSAINSAPMFSLSYVGLQKPVEEIGWVVLNTLFEYFCEQNTAQYTDSAMLATLLGMKPDGSFAATGRLENEIMRKLPRVDEMEHFARTESTELSLEEMSYHEYDRLTMGSFKDYLRSQISCDPMLLEDTVNTYRAFLVENIPLAKLAGLSESAVHTLFLERQTVEPSYQQTLVADAIRDIVRRRCTEEVTKPFYDVVCDVIRRAKKQIEYFGSLRNELLSNHRFTNFSENVKPFYSDIVRQYLGMSQGDKQALRVFYYLGGTETQIETQFMRLIDSVIASHPSFSAAFDEEMKMRIGSADNAAVAGSIQNKLLGHSIGSNACWNTPYALVQTYQGIMMNVGIGKKGDVLFQILQAMFQKQNIDYFNTGSSDAVESVAVFRLNKQHLYSANEVVEGQTGGKAE